eukprot:1319854-Amorphochlora_amoeboformis.AAC.1
MGALLDLRGGGKFNFESCLYLGCRKGGEERELDAYVEENRKPIRRCMEANVAAYLHIPTYKITHGTWNLRHMYSRDRLPVCTE